MRHKIILLLVALTIYISTNAQNVGIGTTAPLTKLNVKSSGYGFIHSDATDNVQVGTFVSASGGWLGTKSNHSLHFFTNNSGEQVTLSTAGNLGIGTTNPTYKLTLGTGVAVALGVDNGASFVAKNSAGTYEYFLYPRWTDNRTILSYGTGGFTIRNNAATTTMTLTDANRVGIGTSTPANNLDVEGSLAVGVNYSGINAAPSNGVLIEGNVGIGITTPATKLDVNGFGHFISASSNASFVEGTLQVEANNSSAFFPCIAFKNDNTNTFAQLYHVNSGGFGVYSGFSYVPMAASAFNVPSDITLKKDITHVNTTEAYEKYLAQIRNIDAITYRYKDEMTSPNPALPNGKVRFEPHVGFSAQSLPAAIQTKLPVAPKQNAEMKLGYNLSDMAGLTLIGIKALDAKMTAVTQQNEELRKNNDKLQKQINDLKALLLQMQSAKVSGTATVD